MRERTFAQGDIKASRLGLGTATWGAGTSEDDAAAQLRMFTEAGGTLLDTANVYGNGKSEIILGALLTSTYRRADFVLTTKAGLVPGKHPLRTDASHARMLSELDTSLRRLGTDHVDLWQVHTWDREVSIEETMSALDTAVTSGRARMAGICNFCGWQTATAATLQQFHGRKPLATIEVEYSLAQRGIEREVVPAARQFGLDILPWAPLGRGVLSGKYRDGIPDSRRDSTFFRWYVERYATSERLGRVVGELLACAAELGQPPVAVALSWVRDRPGVLAPLVGARSAGQLVDSLRSEDVELPPELRQRLDKVSATPITYPERQM
jgi:aryl-alcohol dehydrogenase-like predicted oxidoreductase